MVKSNSLLITVSNMLSIARKGICSEAELNEILSLLPAHSDEAIVGRVFGYSVSDYAYATLKWLGSVAADKEYGALSQHRQREIEELCGKRIYEQLFD